MNLDSSDQLFDVYFSKIENMISAIYRGQPQDPANAISENEYMECNRMVFDLSGQDDGSSGLSTKIQTEFRQFILREVGFFSLSSCLNSENSKTMRSPC